MSDFTKKDTDFAENPHHKANINPNPQWVEFHNTNRLAFA